MQRNSIKVKRKACVFDGWKVEEALPASLMGFLRDKSEDMENMMNTFAYSTLRMAGSEKTAGRDLSHNLSFFRLSICFRRTPGSFFRYHNISKLIFILPVFLWIKRLIVCKLKPFSALRCWFRTGYVIRSWSEGLTLSLGIFFCCISEPLLFTDVNNNNKS